MRERSGEDPPRSVLTAFGLGGGSTSTLGRGHIHATFLVRFEARPAVVIQRLNPLVFTDLEALMANVWLTTSVVRQAGGSTLHFHRGPNPSGLVTDSDGQSWRAYNFVAGSTAHAPVPEAELADVAHHFGRFAAAFVGTDPSQWRHVIPQFHDHRHRLKQFRGSVLSDPVARAPVAAADIDRIEQLVGRLESIEEFAAWHEAPIRLAHHDAKAENIVTPPARATPPVVIDLDTVMAGTILSDVGELIRSCAGTAAEDDPRGGFDPDRSLAVVTGFLDGWGRALDPAEATALPAAGIFAAVQNAVRFLGDHLAGDVYFATDRPDHNLLRCRSMASQAEANLAALDQLRESVRQAVGSRQG